MAVTLQDAVTNLYRIAVTDRAATSTQRLRVLAQYCADQLDRLGLAGAEIEREVPGIGREKGGRSSGTSRGTTKASAGWQSR